MSEFDKICNASKSNDDDDDVREVIGRLHMSTDDNSVLVCANCGKEGSDVNNICNKCKVTTYCNAVCKKVHKKKHKKDCEEHVRLATEKHNEKLRIAVELHDIELFKQPPALDDDCPICFLRMPSLDMGSRYKSCCGKTICNGCALAPVYDNQGNKVDNDKQNECAFCRVVAPYTNEEALERDRTRMEVGDANAIFNMGVYYFNGVFGISQDFTKGLEFFHKAAELGCSKAYNSIGYAYDEGKGVGGDKKKAEHYYELAAIGRCEKARYNLGMNEKEAGNMDRAIKHFMIAVKGGYAESLKKIQELYSNGHATKDDYITALHAYQEYLVEIKSKQRDEAAAYDDDYRYY